MQIDIEKTEKAWNKYILNNEEIPDHVDGVRPEILASWKRSKQNIDPFDKQLYFVSKEELNKRIAQNTTLIKIVYPYLIKFYQYLMQSDYQVILTDAEGCQLKRISHNAKQEDIAQDSKLFDGCLYCEEKVGTNGIGISLNTGKTSMVVGPEHYLKIYHNVVCYSAPIFDSYNNIMSFILITGPLSSYNPLILGMLGSAVNGIENELKLSRSNFFLKSTLEAIQSGIILLDNNLNILHFNQKIADILKLKYSDISNHNLADIINLSNSNIQTILQEDISNFDITITTKDNNNIDVLMTIKNNISNKSLSDLILITIDLQEDIHKLTSQLVGYKAIYNFEDLVYKSSIFTNFINVAKTIAKLDYPCLIYGEKGTGKELIAQSIHNDSQRKNNAFIPVNCGVIQKDYLSIELWGQEATIYDKGQPGKIELAQDGTLFLMEIGNISMEIQERLYNFLVSKKYSRNNSRNIKEIDLRLIATTSFNLLSLVEEGMFRQDLYYYLNAYNLIIPPLRERKEDIMVLAKAFADKYSKLMNKPNLEFSQESIEALNHYSWLGNRRQLESVIECSINATYSNTIELSSLPLDIVNSYYASKNSDLLYSNDSFNNDDVIHPQVKEYNQILYNIKKFDGNVKLVSDNIHMSLSTLYRKLKQYNINPKDYKN